MLFSAEESAALRESLYVLHVEELKHLCARFSLCDRGKKLDLISRILCFATTGEKKEAILFPKDAYGLKGQKVVIGLDVRMLKGIYKNDLKNRLFFKEVIGDHFHFTAFGIDWLTKRWMEGDPPTYEEFAQMWQEEWTRRKQDAVPPKEEWAYINFVQNYRVQHPNALRAEIIHAWSRERDRHIQRVGELLKRVVAIA